MLSGWTSWKWRIAGHRPQTIRAPRLLLLFVVFAAAGCASRPEAGPHGETLSVEKPASDPGVSANVDDSDAETVLIEPNVVSYDDYRDPLIHVNRFVFGFNDIVSRYALVPLGKGYARIVPDPVDRSIDNFFDNIGMPVYAVNNLLQARPASSGRNVLRFAINSTVGILGLFDPAKAWFELEPEQTNFAATLAHYDAGYGVYLVLPFLGPSDVRNATGVGVDYFLHPARYLLDQPQSTGFFAYQYFHKFAQGAEGYQELHDQSKDPYLFMRNLHLQKIQRDADYEE